MSELGACRLNGVGADAPCGSALDTMCQLASAGVYTNTVLQSTSAVLHALCKHEAAALLAAIPQACRDAGPSLAALLQSASALLFAMACMLDCQAMSCAILASVSAVIVSDSATLHLNCQQAA